MKSFLVPRGTADILPEEVSNWREMELQARKLFQNYGYQEIITPIFEERELFARSIGQASDIVEKQMLNLAAQNQDDNGGKTSTLTLRPEGTAAVVRAYIQHNLDKKENLSKLFYVGPMFRGERPQKGRLRQFHQIGAEVIGPQSASPYLDAELIALSVQIIQAIGIQDFQLKLSTLGTDEDKKTFSKYLRDQLKSKLSELCEDCRSRFERNVFRVLDCKKDTCQSVVRKLAFDYEYLTPESRQYFSRLKETLQALAIPFQESPQLVRGLDYYNHTVFEISTSELGSQDALGAGGRYNNLVNQLGGPHVDAVGFALGMERLFLLRCAGKDVSGPGLDFLLIALDEMAFKPAFLLLQQLRKEGLSSDINYQLTSLKSQMRIANKRNARYVIILGENEIKNQTATLKDMNTGQQEELALNYQEIRKFILLNKEKRG
jgi:histidyl-tRNA synthetase